MSTKDDDTTKIITRKIPTPLTQDALAPVVSAQQVSIDTLTREVRDLRNDVKQIAQVINQAKGGWAVAGTVASALGLASGGLSGMLVTLLSKSHP
jgi:hypothetical protein